MNSRTDMKTQKLVLFAKILEDKYAKDQTHCKIRDLC